MTRVWPSTTIRPVSSSTSSAKPVSCFRPASPAGAGAAWYWSPPAAAPVSAPAANAPPADASSRTGSTTRDALRIVRTPCLSPVARRPASTATPGDDSVELLADPLHVAALHERDLGDRTAVPQRGDRAHGAEAAVRLDGVLDRLVERPLRPRHRPLLRLGILLVVTRSDRLGFLDRAGLVVDDHLLEPVALHRVDGQLQPTVRDLVPAGDRLPLALAGLEALVQRPGGLAERR